jgi:hypothetical protein
MSRKRALTSTDDIFGKRKVDPACLDLDDEGDIQPLQCRGVDVEEVDREEASAWVRRKVRQVSSRPVDGGIPLARRILRMVEAATR